MSLPLLLSFGSVLLGVCLTNEAMDLAFQKADRGDGLPISRKTLVKMLTKANMIHTRARIEKWETLFLLNLFLAWWAIGGAIFSTVEGCLRLGLGSVRVSCGRG
jgi:hypothetical protein